MDGSTIVAIIALVVSVGSVVWQLARERWDRPHVIVGGIRGSNGSTGDESRWEYRIDVTNVGERPVTLIEAGMLVGTDDGFQYVGLLGEEVAEFPIRLEPYDSRSWTIDMGPTKYPKPEYKPWVKVVQRPTWRQRRRGTLPQRTIFGDWFGSYGPEPSGTMSRKPTKRRKAKKPEARSGHPVL